MSQVKQQPKRPQDNLQARIASDFSYHTPRPEQVPIYNEIRYRAKEFALHLEAVVPHGRELSTALTKLEECVMHANAAVARHG